MTCFVSNDFQIYKEIFIYLQPEKESISYCAYFLFYICHFQLDKKKFPIKTDNGPTMWDQNLDLLELFPLLYLFHQMITYRKYLCSEVDCIMDAVIKIVQYTCANAMNHHQFMELLKEIEDKMKLMTTSSLPMFITSVMSFTKIYCIANSNSRFS